MKNVMLITGWLCCALIFRAQAQEPGTQTYRDTVLIRLEGRSQIHIIGNRLKELSRYNRADSLKQLFFTDRESAITAGSFPEFPYRLHYLVAPDGRRRLKADFNSDEVTTFDIHKEKQRLYLDLPPLHYTIYDLKENIEIHLYPQDSAAISAMEYTAIKPALQEMSQTNISLRRKSKFSLTKEGEHFLRPELTGNNIDILVMDWHLGGMLIGNVPSPLLGANIYYAYHNRYMKPRWKLGVAINTFVLADFTESGFTNINPGVSYDAIFRFTTSGNSTFRSTWLGLHGGIIYNYFDGGIPRRTFKWGLYASHGNVGISSDLIHLERRNPLPAISIFHTF